MARVVAPNTFQIARDNGVNFNPWSDLMFKTMNVQNQQYTPEDANKTFDIVRSLPEYQAQQAGVDELSNELDRLKKLPQVSGDTWVKPLLALADSETGSKLSQGYDENDLSQKRNEMIMKYQDALANRQKQSADTLMSGLGKFKSGTKTDVGGTDTTGAKLGTGMAQNVANNQTKLDSASIAAAARKKNSGQGKNKFEEMFASEGAKAGMKFISSGGEADTKAMADDLRKIGQTLKGAKNNFISPTGRGGKLQSMASSFLDENVGSAMDKAEAIAVKLSSDDFKGATSDRDAAIMGQGLVSKKGNEDDVAADLDKKAATIEHIGKKRSLILKVQSSGGTSADVAAALKAADDAFYGPTGAGATKTPTTGANQKTATASGPKEGEETTLKSGKKAIFKGGKWQLK